MCPEHQGIVLSRAVHNVLMNIVQTVGIPLAVPRIQVHVILILMYVAVFLVVSVSFAI